MKRMCSYRFGPLILFTRTPPPHHIYIYGCSLRLPLPFQQGRVLRKPALQGLWITALPYWSNMHMIAPYFVNHASCLSHKQLCHPVVSRILVLGMWSSQMRDPINLNSTRFIEPNNRSLSRILTNFQWIGWVSKTDFGMAEFQPSSISLGSLSPRCR